MINSLSSLSTVSLFSQSSKTIKTKSGNYDILQNFGISNTIKDYIQVQMTSEYLSDSLAFNREKREMDFSYTSKEINSLNSSLPSTEDKADGMKNELIKMERKVKGKSLNEAI